MALGMEWRRRRRRRKPGTAKERRKGRKGEEGDGDAASTKRSERKGARFWGRDFQRIAPINNTDIAIDIAIPNLITITKFFDARST